MPNDSHKTREGVTAPASAPLEATVVGVAPAFPVGVKGVALFAGAEVVSSGEVPLEAGLEVVREVELPLVAELSTLPPASAPTASELPVVVVLMGTVLGLVGFGFDSGATLGGGGVDRAGTSERVATPPRS